MAGNGRLSRHANSSQRARLVGTDPVQLLSFDKPDLGNAKSAEKKSDGNSKVWIVTGKDDSQLVLKTDEQGPGREAFATKLAAAAGLNAPRIRYLTKAEYEAANLSAFPRKYLPPNLLVMDHVPGMDLGERSQAVEKGTAKPLEPSELLKIAPQMGAWAAFDYVVGEGDRFGKLDKPRLSSGNFMLGDDGKLTGIDSVAGMLGKVSVPTLEKNSKDLANLKLIEESNADLGKRWASVALAVLVPKDEALRASIEPEFAAAMLAGAKHQLGVLGGMKKSDVEALATEVKKPASEHLTFGLHSGDFDETTSQVAKNIEFLGSRTK